MTAASSATGPLVQAAEGLWTIEGRLGAPKPTGFPRSMSVTRLPDGGLLLWAPIALEGERLAELLALGRPAVIACPSAFHRLDPGPWSEAHPDALVACPAAARARLEQLGRVDATLEEALAPRGAVVHAPPGLKEAERVVEVPLPGGHALLFGDLIFDLPHQPGFGGLILRLLRSSGGPRVTPIGRRFLVADAAALADWLEERAGAPSLRALCFGHGGPRTSDAAETLRAVATGLR